MISYQRLSTYPRFETEARGNSEMAYYRLYFIKTCFCCRNYSNTFISNYSLSQYFLVIYVCNLNVKHVR